jgi:hypothetical protein
VIEMEEIAKVQISVLMDRGVRKIRTNVIRKGTFWGSLKPI